MTKIIPLPNYLDNGYGPNLVKEPLGNTAESLPGNIAASADVKTSAQGAMTYPLVAGESGSTGARVVYDQAGLFGYNASNVVTFSIDASTGNATFSGAISGGTIDIGGADASSFHIDVSGNMWLGDAAFASAPFKVSSAGAVTASNVTITGGALDIGGADATSWHVDSNGNMWSGDTTFANAQASASAFSVSNTGRITAPVFYTRNDGNARIKIASSSLFGQDAAGNNIYTLDVSGSLNFSCDAGIRVGTTLEMKASSAPTGTSNVGKLWCDNGDELWFTDENGTDTQIV